MIDVNKQHIKLITVEEQTKEVEWLAHAHAMDELFMSEINQPVSYRLVSFKQLQMSSLLSQIQNFSNIHLTLFFIRIKTISEIVFSQLITDTRKATLMQVQFGFTMISDLSTLQSEKYQIHTHTPTKRGWMTSSCSCHGRVIHVWNKTTSFIPTSFY